MFIFQLLIDYRKLEFAAKAEELSTKRDVELAGFQIPSNCLSPRITKVGLVQNKIVLPTNVPVKEQVSMSYVL